jgi:hypothetical protein
VKNLAKTQIYIIFPIFFHFYPAENGDGDRSSEGNLKNPKISRGS